MSRGYRITVPLTISSVDLSASDELCIAVSLLPVLSPERLAEILRQTLRDDGWKNSDDNTLHVDLADGLHAELASDATSVRVTRTTTKTVTGTGNTKSVADQAAAAQAKRAEHDLKRTATTSLASAEGDVRARLEAVVQKVYATALEEKARSMGQLESMQRTVGADGTVELVLKIRT